jgi:hypothetical protein
LFTINRYEIERKSKPSIKPTHRAHEIVLNLPVGGRTLSTNIKIAFSALSLILFRIT